MISVTVQELTFSINQFSRGESPFAHVEIVFRLRDGERKISLISSREGG